MKTKVVVLLKILTLICLQFVIVRAEMGCMDNSYHMDASKGCDYKKYHYVYCTCPCSEYGQAFDRGKCERCEHFHDPKPLIIIKDALSRR